MHPVILRYRIIIVLYISASTFDCSIGSCFNAIDSCAESSLVLPSLPQDNALQIEELLDKLSVSLTGEELEIIGKLYQQAMKLEVQFFSPQLVDQPVVAPLSRFNACRPASLLPPEECMCTTASAFPLFLLVCDFAIVDKPCLNDDLIIVCVFFLFYYSKVTRI